MEKITIKELAAYLDYGVTFDKCKDLCDKSNMCAMFNYDQSAKLCHLKTAVEPKKIKPSSVWDMVIKAPPGKITQY